MQTAASPELLQQLIANAAAAICPSCGQRGFWDNRASKKNAFAPDFKCKNQQCSGSTTKDGGVFPYGVWLDKGETDAPPSKRYTPPAPPPRQAPPPAPAPVMNGKTPWDAMSGAYAECVELALRMANVIDQRMGNTESNDRVSADKIAEMAAGMFDKRQKEGAWV